MNHKKELLRSLWVQRHEDLLVGAERGWIAGLGILLFAVYLTVSSWRLGFGALRDFGCWSMGVGVYFRAWERFRV